MVDLHAHILPGLDDGPADLETAVEMARIAVEDGISIIVAAPHFIEGSMENRKDLILQRVDEFQQVLDREGMPLKVIPGAEVYLSPETPERLRRGELLTINNRGTHLLVEFPIHSVPVFAEEILFKLKVLGVTPIIAHPERTIELFKQPERILELTAKGCLIQVNGGSLTGLYGEKVRKTACLLVEQDLIHLIGSDAHSTGGRSPKIKEALDIVEKIKPGKKEEIICNGEKVLVGEEVAARVPSEVQMDRKSFWKKIKSVL